LDLWKMFEMSRFAYCS